MKKRLLSTILILCVAACSAAALSGCTSDNLKKYDFLVTFNYNTENLGLSVSYPDQYLGAKNGQRIMAPAKPGTKSYKGSVFKEKQVERHEITGWYIPEYNDDGSVKKDSGGNVVLSREWDFSSDVVTENITLYASLMLKPALQCVWDDNNDGKIDLENEIQIVQRFLPGEEVERVFFDYEIDPKREGYSFIDYYKDEKFTEKFTFPFTMGDEDVTIYAKFVEGMGWVKVSNATDFNRYFAPTAKLYLEADIDFTGVEWKGKTEFNGMINGNGFKITGIDCTIVSEYNNGNYMGMFGSLGAISVLSNVTFENVKVTVNVNSANPNMPFTAAMFAWRLYKGARLENVTVSGSVSHGNTKPENVSLFGLCTTGEDKAIIKDCDFTGITVNNEIKGEE